MRFLAFFCIFLAACSRAAPGDVPADAGAADAPADALASAGADTPADTSDAPACAGIGALPYVETTQPDVKQRKFAMSLFHFNIEYVIGGLDWQNADGTHTYFLDDVKNKGWDNAKVEDFIVQESLLPMLEMYDKHPDWGVDIEMQAYMVEVMAQRHPKTLDLLRKLAQRGQVELISFHYAAQLFLAFPKTDLHRSLQRVREVFAQNCLPLSGVVFNQEGQAGEGRQKMLLEEGYKIGLFPKNLWKYVHKEFDKQPYWPLYSQEGGDLVVVGGGVDPTSTVQVTWNFYDDGELRAAPKTASGPLNPYFAPNAAHDPKRVSEFEQELAATQAQGFAMVRVSDYVRHLKAIGVQAQKAPPLLDGTWQPSSTHSIHQWMGGAGLFDLLAVESDNAVRAGNVVARHHVAALDVLGSDTKALWDQVFHAEVSDCSGVNPWYGEVQFGLMTNKAIKRNVGTKCVDLLTGKMADAALMKSVGVDGHGIAITYALKNPNFADKPPFEVIVTTADRLTKATWFSQGQDHSVLFLRLAPATCGNDCNSAQRKVEVAFPRLADTIEYSPGLIEDEVRTYPFSSFNFSDGEVWLPLANGLIGLGNGWYVIKHTSAVHVTARISPSDKFVRFIDETLPAQDGVDWFFDVFHGSQADALKWATRINLAPVVCLW